ncbi:MAG TPA: hypothetical protein QGH10_01045, partial [Armatimonadota bacterium]|nr:hypothetical protein [Armatimonadota bacterium]
IFADLGEVQPIASAVIRLLGGGEQGSLNFPDEVSVLLSDDGEDYYLVSARHRRGLDDLSPEAWDLPEEKLAWVHNFALPVGVKARYLAVQLSHQKQFFCTDEVAVVKGADDLPLFSPSPEKRVVLVTDGVAFSSHHPRHPIATQPLRTKIAALDARSGAGYGEAATLVLDLPETVRFVTEKHAESEEVTHDGRAFNRHRIPYDRGKLADFYLQSLLPPGETDTLYMYGDSGNGLENERVTEWESIQIPAIIPPKRLHVSLAWSYAEFLYETWPNYLEAMQGFGFNCVACFPRYWKEEDVPKYQEIFDEAREMGMQIIVNESPAGALAADRDEPEVHSQLPDGPSGHACPSYRGQYYQVEHASFGQHAAWCRPDYIFYDIEAYWNGCVEAKRCSRCQQRFAEGGFDDYDEFCAALGREIHVSMNEVTEKAVADAGIEQSITYGSYRTEPETALNDGLFRFSDLYPDLLQLAMPSLYVAGNQMAVASNISANRAQMDTNDTIPWLSTGTYGEYDPVRTRDMILEALANGARGITYYSYGDFDPLHFKYHAEAVGIVTPIEDIFVDGTPLSDLEADNDQVKLCGIGLDGEIAVLLSNYRGLEPGTEVTISVSGEKGVPVWDLHSRRKIGKVRADGTFRTAIDDINARLFYVGSKHVEALAR